MRLAPVPPRARHPAAGERGGVRDALRYQLTVGVVAAPRDGVEQDACLQRVDREEDREGHGGARDRGEGGEVDVEERARPVDHDVAHRALRFDVADDQGVAIEGEELRDEGADGEVGGDAHSEADDGAGDFGGEARREEGDEDGRRADDEGGPAPQLGGEEAGPELGPGGGAEKFGELSRRDDHGDAREEAAHHLKGDELDEPPRPDHAVEDLEDGGEKGCEGDEPDGLLGADVGVEGEARGEAREDGSSRRAGRADESHVPPDEGGYDPEDDGAHDAGYRADGGERGPEGRVDEDPVGYRGGERDERGGEPSPEIAGDGAEGGGARCIRGGHGPGSM